LKDQLLNPTMIEEEEEHEDSLGDEELGDDELDPDEQLHQRPGSLHDNQQSLLADNLSHRSRKGPSVFTSATERMPEALGFSAPPESGTGMRKRKKMSKKKFMLGDA